MILNIGYNLWTVDLLAKFCKHMHHTQWLDTFVGLQPESDERGARKAHQPGMRNAFDRRPGQSKGFPSAAGERILIGPRTTETFMVFVNMFLGLKEKLRAS
jgi:hypothetical protein